MRTVYGILLSRSKTNLPSDRRPRTEAKQIQHSERLEGFLFSDPPLYRTFQLSGWWRSCVTVAETMKGKTLMQWIRSSGKKRTKDPDTDATTTNSLVWSMARLRYNARSSPASAAPNLHLPSSLPSYLWPTIYTDTHPHTLQHRCLLCPKILGRVL